MTPILKDGKTAIPDDAIESVKKNYVALKGPLAVCFNLGRSTCGDAESFILDPRR